MTDEKLKLSVPSFGLAMGLLWGLSVLILGLYATMIGAPMRMVDLLASIYIGYGATVSGSFVGLAWGFADGLIGGVIFAWLYNVILHCCCKKSHSWGKILKKTLKKK